MSVTVEITRRSDAGGPRQWTCPACGARSEPEAVRANLMVCPACGFHLRIGARQRIAQLADPGSFAEQWTDLRTLDPLDFVDLETYPERLREAQARTGLQEARGGRNGHDRRRAVCPRCARLCLHGWFYGQRGGGEALARRRDSGGDEDTFGDRV